MSAARLLPYAGGAVLLVAAYVCAVLIFGGEDRSGEAGRPEEPSRDRAPAEPGGAIATLGDPDPNAVSENEARTGPRQPVDAQPVQRPRESQGESQGENQESPSGTPDPSEDEPSGSSLDSSQSGVPDGASGYDPLDTGAEPGELSERDVSRVEDAALDYVIYAFGYSGGPGKKDAEAYIEGVYTAVISDAFLDEERSPGGAAVEAFADKVEAEGTESTAYLEDFEITDQVTGEVLADIRFRVEGSGAGSTALYEQSLTFEPWEEQWIVLYASKLQEVEQ